MEKAQDQKAVTPSTLQWIERAVTFCQWFKEGYEAMKQKEEKQEEEEEEEGGTIVQVPRASALRKAGEKAAEGRKESRGNGSLVPVLWREVLREAAVSPTEEGLSEQWLAKLVSIHMTHPTHIAIMLMDFVIEINHK